MRLAAMLLAGAMLLAAAEIAAAQTRQTVDIRGSNAVLLRPAAPKVLRPVPLHPLRARRLNLRTVPQRRKLEASRQARVAPRVAPRVSVSAAASIRPTCRRKCARGGRR